MRRTGRVSRFRGAPAYAWLLALVPLIGAVVCLSVTVGMASIDLRTVVDALLRPDLGIPQHAVIRQLRLPRALMGVIVGACLGVAGAVMQGTTRNDLASPSILGVNAGAAFALALAFAYFGGASLHTLVLVSMLGATLGVVAVHAIGAFTPGGLTPIRLVLSGAAVAALLGALTAGIVIYHDVYQDLLFFQAGGVTGTRWMHVRLVLPWAAGGLAAAILLSPSLSVLHLGEDAAVGLGVSIRRLRVLCTLVVVVLAGAAVAVAGPVGFVGLVVPHVARLLLGVDDRMVVPGSLLLGALLVSGADILARLLHPNQEVPLGMVTALVGVPFLLYLVLRRPERAR